MMLNSSRRRVVSYVNCLTSFRFTWSFEVGLHTFVIVVNNLRGDDSKVQIGPGKVRRKHASGKFPVGRHCR